MRKGERIVFVSSILANSLKSLMHLTIGKVYIISQNSDNHHIWVFDDNVCEMGFAVRTYTFEKLSEYRKKKLKKIEYEAR
jgi:hypothetical protein